MDNCCTCRGDDLRSPRLAVQQGLARATGHRGCAAATLGQFSQVGVQWAGSTPVNVASWLVVGEDVTTPDVTVVSPPGGRASMGVWVHPLARRPGLAKVRRKSGGRCWNRLGGG